MGDGSDSAKEELKDRHPGSHISALLFPMGHKDGGRQGEGGGGSRENTLKFPSGVTASGPPGGAIKHRLWGQAAGWLPNPCPATCRLCDLG